MAQPGRPPKPTNIKLLHGNPGKRPLPEHEPKPALKAPKCPSWMSKEAKKEWRYVVPKLEKVKIITELDRALLEAYCVAYARWKECEQKMVHEDYWVEIVTERDAEGNPTKSYQQQNPLLSVANKARQQMNDSLSQLGLSPSSRARLITSDRLNPSDGKDPLGL